MPAHEALPPAALPVAPVDGVLLDGVLLDGMLLDGVLLEELESWLDVVPLPVLLLPVLGVLALELVSLLPLLVLLPALPPYEPLLCDHDAVARPRRAAATAALIALNVMTWISSRVGGTAQAATQEECLRSPAIRLAARCLAQRNPASLRS